MSSSANARTRTDTAHVMTRDPLAVARPPRRCCAMRRSSGSATGYVGPFAWRFGRPTMSRMGDHPPRSSRASFSGSPLEFVILVTSRMMCPSLAGVSSIDLDQPEVTPPSPSPRPQHSRDELVASEEAARAAWAIFRLELTSESSSPSSCAHARRREPPERWAHAAIEDVAPASGPATGNL